MLLLIAGQGIFQPRELPELQPRMLPNALLDTFELTDDPELLRCRSSRGLCV